MKPLASAAVEFAISPSDTFRARFLWGLVEFIGNPRISVER